MEWNVDAGTEVLSYQIEKSLDGQHFTKPHAFEAAGNNSSARKDWFDANAQPGDNFYRIRVKDQFGAEKNSKIVNVKITDGISGFNIGPNPVVGDHFNIQFNNISKGVYVAKVINNSGQTILKKSINHSGGSANYTIPIAAYSINGICNLQITGTGTSFNKELLIKK